MPIFEIQGPGGLFQVEGPTMEGAYAAFRQSGLGGKPEDYVPPPPTATKPSDNLAEQESKKVLRGALGHIVSGTFGGPGDLLNAIGAGGVVPTTKDWEQRLKGEAYGGVEGIHGDPSFEPTTPAAGYQKAILRNAVGAVLPGSLPLRAANVVLPAVFGEAARQADAPPAVQFGAALAGGLAAGKIAGGLSEAAKVAQLRGAPPTATSTELIKEGGKGFDAFRATGAVVGPDDLVNYVNQARNTLATKGLPAANAGQVHSILDNALDSANAARASGGVISAPDLSALRTSLVNAAKSSDGNVRGAAGMAKSDFDTWLKRTLPAEAPVLEDAVKNTRIGHLQAELQNPVNRATLSSAAANSGMNTENRLRQTLGSLLAKEEDKLAHGRKANYSPEVHALLRDLTTEGGGNFARRASNWLGGGGGALTSVYGLAGATNHPAFFVAPIIGHILKTAGNQKTLAKVDEISKLVMRDAPMLRGQHAQVNAEITKAMEMVQKSRTTAARKSAMLQSLQNIRPANVAGSEENK